jgi:hypothetical protein
MSLYQTGVNLLKQDYEARASEILANSDLTSVLRHRLLTELKIEFRQQMSEEIRVMKELDATLKK